jgi:hypothetical protein
MGVCAPVLVIWWAMRTPTHRRRRRSRSAPGTRSERRCSGWSTGLRSRWTSRADKHIRYLGIEPLGHPATGANRHLVQGKHVWLELDVPLRDRDGRLLAYVYVGDLMVNAELVRQDYAQVTTVPPSGKYAPLFQQLQREAQEAGRGL